MAVLAVGLIQEKVPAGVESVDLELEIAGVGERRLEEYFEVVVVENDGVVLGEGGLDVGLFKLGGDVEIGGVVEDFGPGAEAGKRSGRALDVDEVGGPGGEEPGRVIELAVDLRGTGGEMAGIAFRGLQAGAVEAGNWRVVVRMRTVAMEAMEAMDACM